MHGNQSGVRKRRESAERDKNLIGPVEAHNGLPYQIWAQSDQRFVKLIRPGKYHKLL